MLWLTSCGSKSITLFDKNGQPLSPADGINLNGQLGLMQGIIVTRSGDVWAVGISKNQLVYFFRGDLTKGHLICEGLEKEPCRSFRGPFHLGIDQQDRFWVASAAEDSVARFPAADPSMAETFKTGYSGSGLVIDSKGNVWVTTRLGDSAQGKASFEKFVEIMRKTYDDAHLVRTMHGQVAGRREAASLCCGRMAANFPGRHSPATVYPAPGLLPWKETAMSRCHSLPGRRAGSRTCAACGPKPARPV
jgi:hypothetical protein